MNFLSFIPLVNRVVDKILPDEKAKEAAKLELLKLQGSQEIEQINSQLSAIVAEAQSNDPWTSRARPSFLYVIYIFILSSIPMGVLYAASPETANNITAGVTGWLNAFPDQLYTLFGVGYLGYTGARTIDKRKVK